MKKLLLSLGLALMISGAAQAKIPPEVMEPYKAYQAAVKNKDLKAARKNALAAWQAGETHLGDSKTTGDLAQNYALLDEKDDKSFKKKKAAHLRSIELSTYHDNPVMTRLEREVNFLNYATFVRRISGLSKRTKKAIEYAEANGAGRSTFVGELYTYRAQFAVKSGNHKKTEDYASKALDIFNNADDGYATYQPILARLYSGYGKEGQKDLLPAALDYQEVMQNIENKLPRDHPLLMRSLGRWMSMRDRLSRAGEIEEAEQAGLCECWPYDKKRNESVRPIKRVAPKMPRRAYQSGFSIVEFDLTDDGGTSNIRILESWPKEIFEKSSEKAVEQWEFNPRTAEESDGDRKDIITTIRYRLTDSSGNMIE